MRHTQCTANATKKTSGAHIQSANCVHLLFGDNSNELEITENFLVRLTEFSNGGFEATVRRVGIGSKGQERERDQRDIIRDRLRQIAQTRQAIRHKVKENGCDRMLTLTRAPTNCTYKDSLGWWQSSVEKFIAALRRIGYSFQYVAVPQRHKSGHWHCHIALNASIRSDDARRAWSAIAGPRSNARLSWHIKDDILTRVATIAGYITKEIALDWDEFAKNARHFWSSQGSAPRQKTWIIRAREILHALRILAAQLRLDYDAIISNPACHVFHTDGDGVFLNFLPGLEQSREPMAA